VQHTAWEESIAHLPLHQWPWDLQGFCWRLMTLLLLLQVRQQIHG
jgi:hypothetical protein